MNTIIEMKNVNFSYQREYERIDIFHDLNMKIEEKGVFAILGESGSGKSSILNLIAGFVKPQTGEVLVKGKNICKLNENESCKYRNKDIGFVYQSFILLPKLTAIENVMLPLIIAGEKVNSAKEKADELLQFIGLQHRGKHFSYQLSGGEQQRVAIARALINNPPVILADEPTGNLDKKNSMVIKEYLEKISESGKTIVLVTHDNSFVDIATKLIYMNELNDR